MKTGTAARSLNSFDVRYKVTAARYAYPRGYIGDSTARYVVPRAAVYKPRGRIWPRICPYDIEEDKPLMGYDGRTYGIGDRVELHPGTDLWMRGAKFGTVVGTSVTPQDRVHVELDHMTGKFSGPERHFRKVPV
jgi:hypothetical protein